MYLKIYSLYDINSGRGGPKVFSEQPHLASGHFMKVFYKTTTCPRQPIMSGHKSGRLIQV